MPKFLKLFISIAACLLAGFLGSLATNLSIDNWYANLTKPFFNPPNWIFAPVWTILFILMGISVFLIWEKGIKKNTKALMLFDIQLILNILWSVIFFTLHSPFFAFIEITILWLFILFTIIKFYKVSRVAGIMMIPYILWVSFASILNFSIFWLNR